MENSQTSQYIIKRNWRRQNRNAHLSDDRRRHRQSTSVDGENVPVVCLTRYPHVEDRVRTFIDTTMFLRQPFVRIFKDPYVETRLQSYLQNTSSFSVAATTTTTTTTSKTSLPDLNINNAVAATNNLPKRRHAVVPHKRTYKFALQTQNVKNAPKYNIGTLNQICPHCEANFFTLEKPKCDREGSRFACCNFGKVNLPQLAPCPDELYHLLTSDDALSIQYRKNIRSANNLFAMASFKAKIPQDRNIGQGPWCFNICGQIYHFTEPLPFPNNEDPILSSYYFIEAEDAIERRANFVRDRINRGTITVLENMLRQYNRWVRSYKTIKEWTEITTNLDGKQQWQHRPDLVCRVFASKLAELIDDTTNKQYFGVPLNYMYVIEFQKRGLPHAHILLTLRPEDKLQTEQEVDSAVSARIPNPQQEPQMYELIKRHFIHRPCGGVEHANAACIIDGRCSKGYPKAFRESTVLLGNNRIRQPEYKRPND
ncbi:hypothetical protein TcasGA2_TC004078 [Tribolium castaneum]|uniref:Helitron helicase-like domain-containing protein n=1 Tax=Tribolium castaneum TaxID=7070 RepID=D7GXQ3_TRICA|nr:hypothetical protein TcasGA2_TC004078 [Tribolium castaneum]